VICRQKNAYSPREGEITKARVCAALFGRCNGETPGIQRALEALPLGPIRPWGKHTAAGSRPGSTDVLDYRKREAWHMTKASPVQPYSFPSRLRAISSTGNTASVANIGQMTTGMQ